MTCKRRIPNLKKIFIATASGYFVGSLIMFAVMAFGGQSQTPEQWIKFYVETKTDVLGYTLDSYEVLDTPAWGKTVVILLHGHYSLSSNKEGPWAGFAKVTLPGTASPSNLSVREKL